jgi:hypothetical protein
MVGVVGILCAEIIAGLPSLRRQYPVAESICVLGPRSIVGIVGELRTTRSRDERKPSMLRDCVYSLLLPGETHDCILCSD